MVLITRNYGAHSVDGKKHAVGLILKTLYNLVCNKVIAHEFLTSLLCVNNCIKLRVNVHCILSVSSSMKMAFVKKHV